MRLPAKIILPFFIASSFIVCLPFTDGKTSIIIRKFISPQSFDTGDNIYARTYLHGASLSKYRIREEGRNMREISKPRGRREGLMKNYASRFRTWNKDPIRVREYPIKGAKPFKRRRPTPSHPLGYVENEIFRRRPGRPHKHRVNHFQPPKPHSEASDSDSDNDDYYFSDETKRAEAQYSFGDGYRRPVKKRRNPNRRKKRPKKPILRVKPSYDDDDKRIAFDDDRKVVLREEKRGKPKKELTFSYATFVRHPTKGNIEVDYDYPSEEEEDDAMMMQSQKKNRRVKKKTNKYRTEEENEDYRGVEIYSPDVESFSQYQDDKDHEYEIKAKMKINNYSLSQPVFGEGHISNSSPSPAFSSSSLFRAPVQENYSLNYQMSPTLQRFNTGSYPQTQAITKPSSIYGPPYDTASYSGFSEPNAAQYKKITQPSRDFSYQQSNPYKYHEGSSVGDSAYSSSYISIPVTSYENLIPGNSHTYHKVQTYQEQKPSQSSVYYSNNLGSVNSGSFYHKDTTSPYHKNPIFDNTDSFSGFNSNASNQKRYTAHISGLSTYSSKYSEQGGVVVPGARTTEKPEDEDFLRKHQNLYNNGINGVPIQGNGYMKKEIKDYDIGYGEFQFDENPA